MRQEIDNYHLLFKHCMSCMSTDGLSKLVSRWISLLLWKALKFNLKLNILQRSHDFSKLRPSIHLQHYLVIVVAMGKRSTLGAQWLQSMPQCRWLDSSRRPLFHVILFPVCLCYPTNAENPQEKSANGNGKPIWISWGFTILMSFKKMKNKIFCMHVHARHKTGKFKVIYALYITRAVTAVCTYEQ